MITQKENFILFRYSNVRLQMPYTDQIANFTLHVRTISDICTIVLEQKSMQDNFIERHVNAHVG